MDIAHLAIKLISFPVDKEKQAHQQQGRMVQQLFPPGTSGVLQAVQRTGVAGHGLFQFLAQIPVSYTHLTLPTSDLV